MIQYLTSRVPNRRRLRKRKCFICSCLILRPLQYKGKQPMHSNRNPDTTLDYNHHFHNQGEAPQINVSVTTLLWLATPVDPNSTKLFRILLALVCRWPHNWGSPFIKDLFVSRTMAGSFVVAMPVSNFLRRFVGYRVAMNDLPEDYDFSGISGADGELQMSQRLVSLPVPQYMCMCLIICSLSSVIL